MMTSEVLINLNALGVFVKSRRNLSNNLVVAVQQSWFKKRDTLQDSIEHNQVILVVVDVITRYSTYVDKQYII